MQKHSREFYTTMARIGVKVELLRQKKHTVYQLTGPSGKTMRYTTSASPSDRRSLMNAVRDVKGAIC